MERLAIDGGKAVRNEPYDVLPNIDENELKEVEEVIKGKRIAEFSGAYKVADFEKAFADYIGSKYAIATNAGTAAIHLALQSVGIGPGDEVIVPPFTFVGTVSPILQMGAIPVFVDISPQSYCIDPKRIEDAVSKKTKAILPVHLYGNAADMDEIIRIAREKRLYVIEDACQAHGTIYRQRKVGSIGNAGCFSFAISKNMTTGEGGMVTTDDERIAWGCKMARQNGKSDWRTHVMIGYNYRMTELSAAIGLVQLKKLGSMNERRKSNADIYRKELESTGLVMPHVEDGVSHVYYKFPILMPSEHADKRDWFVNAVRKENVPVEEGYPYPLYKISFLHAYERNCPVAEDVTKRIVNLYSAPTISEEVVMQTCDAIKKVMAWM